MSQAERGRVADPPGPVVAVVGRTNVGKSTLVNRLRGSREAIVEERPGVTRDRTTHPVEWAGRRFTLVDSGGWTPSFASSGDELDREVTEQARQAVAAADVVLCVVDAAVGITEEDAAVADWLRNAEVDVVLVANKADTLVDTARPEAELAELYALGLGEPVGVSALHGTGAGDLLDEVLARLEARGALDRPGEPDEEAPGVMLMGRRNVGKSSLFNRLLGQPRTVVDERPGTTRDAVDTVVAFSDGRAYRFVDTAGLRRRQHRARGTEYYSAVRTRRALEASAVALLVMDVAEPIGEAEQRLAREVIDAGRALVLVWNKWDAVDEDRRDELERERDLRLDFVSFAPLVRTSAITGRGVDRLPRTIDTVLSEWRRRIPTARLNEWLAETVEASPPPRRAGGAVRLRYITQVGSGPPTFRIFANSQLDATYRRYLERRLREAFGFTGTPLRIGVRVRPGWEERARAG